MYHARSSVAVFVPAAAPRARRKLLAARRGFSRATTGYYSASSLADVREPYVEEQRPVEVLQGLVVQNEIQRALSAERRGDGPDGVPLRGVSAVRQLLLQLPGDLDAADAALAHLEHRLFERGDGLSLPDGEHEGRVRLARGLDFLRLVPRGVPHPLDDHGLPRRWGRAVAHAQIREARAGGGLHERHIPGRQRRVAVRALRALRVRERGSRRDEHASRERRERD
mmetsp:Transcript_4713/g.18891  ORF Transcript_4713/g.18891 Transcript_4713/m.18891 type:complete len:225 (-) Transcript_4713:266-940(-)